MDTGERKQGDPDWDPLLSARALKNRADELATSRESLCQVGT